MQQIYIHGPRHAEAILNDTCVELACVVDSSPAAEAVAEKLKCPLFKSVQVMLASSHRPDAALVCTPNHSHVPISKELLEGGLHVLCEKPISVDVASGQKLVLNRETHNRHLLIGHHRRFNRYVVTTKKLLPSLGQIVPVNGVWTIYKPPEYFDSPTEWRRLATAGVVLINLSHEIDILHHLFEPIIRVFAEKSASQRGHAAEEGAAITLRLKNGIVDTFLVSDAVVSPHNFESGTGGNPTIPKVGQDFYRIFGSSASLSVPQMMKWTHPDGVNTWNSRPHYEILEVPEMKIPFKLQIEHFVKVIRGEEKPSCSGIEGLRAVLVCEAIRKSMQDNLPVDISVD
ncbi:NAD(P)-binding protein [Pleomassaria siparia CBS 279.74]|uniref:NAD(P)-binding protein n=1 Tax=Pleomassaria siparia CBS 279.74 TaxID=1314801 RepID=A0A6G1KHU7_9PLEO|nr:NAD(P)-binding protein [Pleomassaria siparia CBS 279.74]